MRMARIIRLYEAELAARDATIAGQTEAGVKKDSALDDARRNLPDATDEDAMLKAEARFAGKE